jgi:hypothetical protein
MRGSCPISAEIGHVATRLPIVCSAARRLRALTRWTIAVVLVVQTSPMKTFVLANQTGRQLLWEMKKTAAREASLEIEPVLRHLAGVVIKGGAGDGV